MPNSARALYEKLERYLGPSADFVEAHVCANGLLDGMLTMLAGRYCERSDVVE